MPRLPFLLLLLPLMACDPPPPDTTMPTGRPEGQFSKLEQVELAREGWGLAEAPRLEGEAALAWNEATETLFATRGGSGRVVAVGKGGQLEIFDLATPAAEEVVLLLDEERQRLVWVGFPDETVRWLDIATGEVVASRDPATAAPDTREPLYDHRQAALDPATGWVWVADPGGERVMGYGPDGNSLRVPTLQKPVALAFGADGRLWVLDALGRDEVRLVAFTPGSLAVEEKVRVGVPHWYEGPPAFLVPHGDGGVSVIGHHGATLEREYWPAWWEALPAPAWPLGAVELGREIAVLHLVGGKGGVPVVAVGDATTGDLLRTLPQPADSTTIIGAGSGQVAVAGASGPARLVDLADRETPVRLSFAMTADRVWSRGGLTAVLDRTGGTVWFRGEEGWQALASVPLTLDLAATNQENLLYLRGGREPEIVWGNLGARGWRDLPLGPSDAPSVLTGRVSLNRDGDLAAVLLPSRREVLLADLTETPWTVRWRTSLEGLEPAAEVVFDQAGRLLVGWPEGRLWALDEATGEVLAEVNLPKLLGAPLGYPEGNLFVDEAGGRIFVGPQALDAVTLEPGAVLPAAQRVLWSDANTVLGLQRQGRGAEWLVQSDAASLATTESWSVGVNSGRPGVSFYDAAAGVLWVPDPLRARLTAWPYPP